MKAKNITQKWFIAQPNRKWLLLQVSKWICDNKRREYRPFVSVFFSFTNRRISDNKHSAVVKRLEFVER